MNQFGARPVTETGQETAAVPALAVGGLRKSFSKPAVDGLDLTVAPGEF